jgi:2-dehydro-3-deoxyphosphogluconate aldolase/(4S)-4-hydroxy-2-oxoglutarate aldolase
MVQNRIRQLLINHPIIPVVKIESIDQVIPYINHLRSKNINCIEITLRTKCAIDAIKKAKKYFGDQFAVGVGTVINETQINAVINANVDFIVLPGVFSELREPLEQSNIPFLPGVMTASEIMHGASFGWNTFKLFPANLVGGINGIKTFSKVFPEIKFCPTGGINKGNYLEFLAEESVISIGGSWLIEES